LTAMKLAFGRLLQGHGHLCRDALRVLGLVDGDLRHAGSGCQLGLRSKLRDGLFDEIAHNLFITKVMRLVNTTLMGGEGNIAIKLIMKMGEKIRTLREARNWSQDELAARVGISQPAVLKIENGKTIKTRFLPDIAKVFGVSMDEVSDDPEFVSTSLIRQKSEVTMASHLPSESEKRIPILGVATGGADGEMVFDGEAIEWVATPDYLIGVRDAYCVYVTGESMVPRYFPGERLDVHPRKPPRRDEDVVVQLHPDEEGGYPRGFIKVFVTQTPTTLVLRQYNPPKEIEVPLKRVLHIHYVMGRRSRS